MKKLLSMLAVVPLAMAACSVTTNTLDIEKPDAANKGQTFLYDVVTQEYALDYTNETKVSEHIGKYYTDPVTINGGKYDKTALIEYLTTSNSGIADAEDIGLEYDLNLSWKSEKVDGATTEVVSEMTFSFDLFKEDFVRYLEKIWTGPGEFDDFYTDELIDSAFNSMKNALRNMKGTSQSTTMLIANGDSYLITELK